MMTRLKSMLTKHKGRVRSRKFLEASMGASALVATADGEVSFAELLGRDHVLDRVTQLQVFDAHEAADLFHAHVEAIEADATAGARDVHKVVAKVAGDVELAQLLLRVCVAIAKADSDFSDKERTVVAGLCETLGVVDISIDSLPESD